MKHHRTDRQQFVKLTDTESDDSQQASWLPATGTGKGGECLGALPHSTELVSPPLTLQARVPSRRTASQPDPDGRLGNAAGGEEEGMQLEQTTGPPTRGAEGGSTLPTSAPPCPAPVMPAARGLIKS